MEYRIIFHTIDDDLQQEINSISERKWTIKTAFPPEKYKNSNDLYILIIWERKKL